MCVYDLELPLTSAGRPALFGNEVEIYSEENISLYDHSNKTPFQRGRCSITTHRLFYLDETKNPPLALFLPLEWITKLSKEAGFLARSGKGLLDFLLHEMVPYARIHMYGISETAH